MAHAKLIYISKKSTYEAIKTDTEYLDALRNALVFVEDTGELYTHEHSFGGNLVAVANNLAIEGNTTGILAFEKGNPNRIYTKELYALPTTPGVDGQIWVSKGDGTGYWENIENFLSLTNTSKALDLTVSWKDIIDLPTTEGVYALKIAYSFNRDSQVIGQSPINYTGIASGLFSISSAADNVNDEIPLHIHGNLPEGFRIYACTKGTKLAMASTEALILNLTFTYKRLI